MGRVAAVVDRMRVGIVEFVEFIGVEVAGYSRRTGTASSRRGCGAARRNPEKGRSWQEQGRGGPFRVFALRRPPWPAGHLPHGWGDHSIRRICQPPIINVARTMLTPEPPISPAWESCRRAVDARNAEMWLERLAPACVLRDMPITCRNGVAGGPTPAMLCGAGSNLVENA